jgi:hypothetical protein
MVGHSVPMPYPSCESDSPGQGVASVAVMVDLLLRHSPSAARQSGAVSVVETAT